MSFPLRTAARTSTLSRLQVVEVLQELKRACDWQGFGWPFEWLPRWMETRGDIDQETSLRGMEGSDFFTREVDASLLDGSADVAIHSAKDLPSTLPATLTLFALTKGLDARDSLVLPPGMSLHNLPPKARLATSSQRRSEALLALRPDATIVDIRGSIEVRLGYLESGAVNGVVVAEAALLRLGLTHLNRCYLPTKTAPLQGRLAIVGRTSDRALQQFFVSIHDPLPILK